MTKLIFGIDNWRNIYSNSSRDDKYKIWICILLSNDQDIYLKDYDDWFEFKEYCLKNKLKIKKIGLKYRSHQIEQNIDCGTKCERSNTVIINQAGGRLRGEARIMSGVVIPGKYDPETSEEIKAPIPIPGSLS